MPGVLKISERASLALHAMAYLTAQASQGGAGQPGAGTVRVRDLAKQISASSAHLSKVLQSLARAGLIIGARGPAGGYRLARPAREITLLQAVEAVEGPLDASACLFASPVCTGECCLLGEHVDRFNRALREHLGLSTLDRYANLFPKPRRS